MGKIGQEYSYCALKGYKIKQKGIDGWENTYKYPVCYKDNKPGKVKKEIYLLKLAYDEGDYASMFDIQDSVIIEPENPTVARIEPTGGGGTRSPIAPYDWRDVFGKNYLNETIEDQGDSDMCYAVATSVVAETAYNKSIGAYSKESGPDTSEDMADFSTGYVAFCGKECDYSKIWGYYGINGYSNNLFPLEFVYENGITNEEDQGTSFSEYGVCGSAQLAYDRSFFAGWGTVSTSTSSIKGALISYGPLYASLKFRTSWNTYDPDEEDDLEDKIIVDSVPEPCGPYGYYHAVVIVGWGFLDDEESPANGLYWIVRNSKGSDWGLGGYAYVHEYSLKLHCQIGYIDGDQPNIDREYIEDDSSNRTITLEDEFPIADDIDWEVTPTSVFNSPYTGTNSTASVDTDPPTGAGQRGYIEFTITVDSLSLCPNAPDKIITLSDSIWIGKPETPVVNGYSAIGCGINYDYEIDEDNLEGSVWYIWSTSSNITLVSSDTTSSSCTIQPTAGGSGWINVESHNVNGYTYDTKSVNITCMNFAIYPNPSSQELTVEIFDDTPDNNYEVELYNSKGERKKSKNTKTKKVYFSVLDLDDGSYIVKVNAFDNNGTLVADKTSSLIISK